MNRQALIIGAGVGGLTTAALLLKAGWRVTVLEAHIYPGGSAGTFFHKGYRFDAGATLAGGFGPGGPHARVASVLGIEWPIQPQDPAWVVHLNGRSITQWADAARWREERQRALPGSEDFWRQQEQLAELSWQISSRDFPWPPVRAQEWARLAGAVRPRTLLAAPHLARPIGSLLPRSADALLRTFVDAQLLISAQTTSQYANALYASAALDLPRRGVNRVRGGIGALSTTLGNWITANGGQVLYRQEVQNLLLRDGRAVGARTKKGLEVQADVIIANLTPAGLARLLPEPARVQTPAVKAPLPMWSSFNLYLGLDASLLPAGSADHHQVVVDANRPLGEGNSVFISLSPADDAARAPQGMRAASLSTHTAASAWWDLAQRDEEAFAARKEDYTQRMLHAAEIALPGIRQAVRLLMPATPLTWQNFTRRPFGLVGGYPQTSILKARGPATDIPGLWLVGDSIFPGQSTAGTTLGAVRVASLVAGNIPGLF